MPSQNQYSNDNFDARSHYSDSAATTTATNNALYNFGSLNRTLKDGSKGCTRAYSNCSGGGGTLRTSHFKSNQSLCSCNAETEVFIFE